MSKPLSALALALLPSGQLDVDKLLAAHRATFGSATMTAPEGDPSVPPAPPAPAPTPGPPAPAPTPAPGVSMTQEELGKLAAAEKRQGQRAILRALGVEGVDSMTADQVKAAAEGLKTQLDQARAVELAQMTEAQRAQAEAATAKAAADADRQQAALTLHGANLTVALALAGVPKDNLADVGKLVDVELGADEATITAAVAKVQEKYPALFTPASSTPPPAPSGGPTGTPPRPTPPGDAYERGAARHKAAAPAGV